MISATQCAKDIQHPHQPQQKWDTLKVKALEEIIAFSVEYKMDRSSISNETFIDSRVKARAVVSFALLFLMKGRRSECWNVRHPFDETTFRDGVDA